MAHFEQSEGATDEWYTPTYIFDALATTFHMDVAYPAPEIGGYRPAVPARKFVTRDSLSVLWEGFVWCNPPFGGRNGIVPWLDKFFLHGDGIVLTPDRTSAPWWQAASAKADLHMFIAGKVRFIRPDGTPGPSPNTGTTLFAAGLKGAHALKMAEAAGLGSTFRRA